MPEDKPSLRAEMERIRQTRESDDAPEPRTGDDSAGNGPVNSKQRSGVKEGFKAGRKDLNDIQRAFLKKLSGKSPLQHAQILQKLRELAGGHPKGKGKKRDRPPS